MAGGRRHTRHRERTLIGADRDERVCPMGAKWGRPRDRPVRTVMGEVPGNGGQHEVLSCGMAQCGRGGP